MNPARLSPSLLLQFEELADEVVRLAGLEGIDRVTRFHEALGFLLHKHQGLVEQGYQSEAAGQKVLRGFGSPLVMARSLRPFWGERWALQLRTAPWRWAWIFSWLILSPFIVQFVHVRTQVGLDPALALKFLLPGGLGLAFVHNQFPVSLHGSPLLRRMANWMFFVMAGSMQFVTLQPLAARIVPLRSLWSVPVLLLFLKVGFVLFLLAMAVELTEAPVWWQRRQRKRRLAELEASQSPG